MDYFLIITATFYLATAGCIALYFRPNPKHHVSTGEAIFVGVFWLPLLIFALMLCAGYGAKQGWERLKEWWCA